MSWLPPIIVLAMLSLAGFGYWCLAGPTWGNAKVQLVAQDIKAITRCLKTYKINAGRYPSTAQGFAELISRPDAEPLPDKWVHTLKKVPLDPWGREYRYQALPDGDERGFEILSAGKDGQFGTADDLSSLDP